MNCHACKLTKIGPKIQPYGGFMCSQDHIQCKDCNTFKDGLCQICNEKTNFFSVQFSVAPVKQQETEAAPLALPEPEPAEPQCPRSFIDDLKGGPDGTQYASTVEISEVESDSTSNIETNSEQAESARADYGNVRDEIANVEHYQNAIYTNEHAHLQYLQASEEIYSSEVIYFRQIDEGHSEQSSEITSDIVHYEANTDNNKTMLTEAAQINEHRSRIERKATTDSQPIYRHMERKICSTKPMQSSDANGGIQDHNEHVNAEREIMESTKVITVKEEIIIETTQTIDCNTEVAMECGSLSNETSEFDKSDSVADKSEFTEGYQDTNIDNSSAISYEDSASTIGDGAGDMHNIMSIRSNEEMVDVGRVEDLKFFTPENLIIRATGLTQEELTSSLDPSKPNRTSLDIRLQRVLETIRENPLQLTLDVHRVIDHIRNTPQIPKNYDQLTQDQKREINLQRHISSEDTATVISEFISMELNNAYRSVYNPPPDNDMPYMIPCLEDDIIRIDDDSDLDEPSRDEELPKMCAFEPAPQFMLVSSQMAYNPQLLSKMYFIKLNPIPNHKVHILRTPIECPESSCKRIIFVSDFVKHLTVDHSKVPVERIAPYQCKNFFIDPRLAQNGISKCNLLYLLRDIVTDLGNSRYRNYLPLMVMTTRISLTQMCNINSTKYPLASSNIHFLMIWLTGIKPEDVPIAATLTIWSRTGPNPICHVTNAGPMYNIRDSQDVHDVWKSGNCLILPNEQVRMLTRNGQDLLELQILVH